MVEKGTLEDAIRPAPTREEMTWVYGFGFAALSIGLALAAYLRVVNGGLLQTGAGFSVMGNDGPIALPPYEKLDIGADGTLSIIPVGQDASALAVIDRIKLVNPSIEDLEKNLDGFIRARDGVAIDPDASVRVASGTVEGSNVNSVSELINMIELARKFEMHVKLMETAESNDSSSATILRLRG